MNLNKNKNKGLSFDYKDIYSFFEGLDLFINFSIIIYLSNYIFPEIDLRVSMIYSVIIIITSFLSKILLPYTLLKLGKIQKVENLFYYLSFLSYLLVIIIPSGNVFFISVILLVISRFFIGITFAFFNPIFLKNYDSNREFDNNSVIKHFLLLMIGIIFGSILYSIINESFSNNELNDGGWKIFYLVFLLSLSLFLFFKKFFFKISNNNDEKELLDNFNGTVDIKNLFNNFQILVPLYFLILFSSSFWLPKFTNPENMQFLDYKIIFIVLTFLFCTFLYPLLRLIGKKRSSFFLSIFLLVISILVSFFSKDSSYAINFLKFFISLVSGLSICIYLLDYRNNNRTTIKELFYLLSFPYFILGLFIPLSFYYFIHFSISYNIIYVFFSFIFLICLISRIYNKR